MLHYYHEQRRAGWGALTAYYLARVRVLAGQASVGFGASCLAGVRVGGWLP